MENEYLCNNPESKVNYKTSNYQRLWKRSVKIEGVDLAEKKERMRRGYGYG